MKIGELLVNQGNVSFEQLARALAEQRAAHTRVVSMLIEHGAIDFDAAARALGEQRGSTCVLQKHLAARDPALARLVPAELGRSVCALPIGRASNGALVVCVRDPSPQLQHQLARATGTSVMLVIAPAKRLERLVADAYGPAPDEEFDVAMDSAVDMPGLPPAPPAADEPDPLDPDTVRLALTDLDDVRVSKEMGVISGIHNLAKLSGPALPPRPPSMDETRQGVAQGGSRDQVTDTAVKYLAGKWVAGIVLAIRGAMATGYRGFGSAVGDATQISLPVAAPSVMQRAIASKRTSIQQVAGPMQDALARLLGTQIPSAAPVVVGGNVVAVIVVGDPILGFGDTDRATADLGRVAHMLGEAYERLASSR